MLLLGQFTLSVEAALTRFHLATVAMFMIVPQETIPAMVQLAFFALPVESVFQSDTDTKYS